MDHGGNNPASCSTSHFWGEGGWPSSISNSESLDAASKMFFFFLVGLSCFRTDSWFSTVLAVLFAALRPGLVSAICCASSSHALGLISAISYIREMNWLETNSCPLLIRSRVFSGRDAAKIQFPTYTSFLPTFLAISAFDQPFSFRSARYPSPASTMVISSRSTFSISARTRKSISSVTSRTIAGTVSSSARRAAINLRSPAMRV
jgi:hypothetical protein